VPWVYISNGTALIRGGRNRVTQLPTKQPDLRAILVDYDLASRISDR
jgi:hypothetical protein